MVSVAVLSGNVCGALVSLFSFSLTCFHLTRGSRRCTAGSHHGQSGMLNFGMS